MDFKSLTDTYPRDKDLPQRAFDIAARRRVLDGTMYDTLLYPFDMERNDAREYIPLKKRRPSVRRNLCRTVVDDSVSLLFSEGHFPTVELSGDKSEAYKVQLENLQRLLKESALNLTMINAARRGAVGSVCILFKVLKGRVFFDVLDTAHLTPEWKSDEPDTLEAVTERYKVTGADLRRSGYTINDNDLGASFWFQRTWDETAETWFVPVKVVRGEFDEVTLVDADRTTTHGLGFVPVVWVRNLPGGDRIDGLPTFPTEAVDTQIEMDYQMSQGGRALRYAGDPTLLIKDSGGMEGGPMVKGAANALIVDAEGDAKLLEINGTATSAVIEYVRALRESALEDMHGNRANADKLSAAQSGRAMELMNQALIWLADNLRISYGEQAITELISMVVRASLKLELVFKDGERVGSFDTKRRISLRWPAWYAPTASDRSEIATTLKTHTDSGHMSRETALRVIADSYDIEDVDKEANLIKQEVALRDAGATKTVTVQE